MAGTRVPLPAPICPLGLAFNGLAVLAMHWSRLTGVQMPSVSLGCALTAAALLASYLSNFVRCPGAITSDFSNTASLPALNAGQALLSALIARFGAQVLPMYLLHACLIACYVLGCCIALRFLTLCYRAGQWPDPSWFPAVLLPAMGALTSHGTGPDFLRSKWQYGLFLVALMPLLAVVTYRMLLSKTRDSVAPNAGMATLMAPNSLYAFMYISKGMPFGEELGYGLFAGSTAWCLMTLFLLFKRRALWTGAFHPSYVSLTFPAASTASAATLASERLKLVAGSATRIWAAILTVIAAIVCLLVAARFIAFVVGNMRQASKVAVAEAEKTSKAPAAEAKNTSKAPAAGDKKTSDAPAAESKKTS